MVDDLRQSFESFGRGWSPRHAPRKEDELDELARSVAAILCAVEAGVIDREGYELRGVKNAAVRSYYDMGKRRSKSSVPNHDRSLPSSEGRISGALFGGSFVLRESEKRPDLIDEILVSLKAAVERGCSPEDIADEFCWEIQWNIRHVLAAEGIAIPWQSKLSELVIDEATVQRVSVSFRRTIDTHHNNSDQDRVLLSQRLFVNGMKALGFPAKKAENMLEYLRR